MGPAMQVWKSCVQEKKKKRHRVFTIVYRVRARQTENFLVVVKTRAQKCFFFFCVIRGIFWRKMPGNDHIAIVKLEKSNFSFWKCQIRNLLIANKLLDIVEGKRVMPTDATATDDAEKRRHSNGIMPGRSFSWPPACGRTCPRGDCLWYGKRNVGQAHEDSWAKIRHK